MSVTKRGLVENFVGDGERHYHDAVVVTNGSNNVVKDMAVHVAAKRHFRVPLPSTSSVTDHAALDRSLAPARFRYFAKYRSVELLSAFGKNVLEYLIILVFHSDHTERSHCSGWDRRFAICPTQWWHIASYRQRHRKSSGGSRTSVSICTSNAMAIPFTLVPRRPGTCDPRRASSPLRAGFGTHSGLEELPSCAEKKSVRIILQEVAQSLRRYPRSKARATTMRCTSEGPSPIRLIRNSRYHRSNGISLATPRPPKI